MTTWLRFPNRHTLDTAVTVLAATTDDRATCARHLRARFANYTERPPDTGVGMELSAVLDLIEQERALHPPVKVHPEFRPYPHKRRRAKA